RVNTYTTNFQRRPAVAMDSDGDFVVTWTSTYQDGSGYGVYGQRYDMNGNALGGEFRVNTTYFSTENYLKKRIRLNCQQYDRNRNPKRTSRRYTAVDRPT